MICACRKKKNNIFVQQITKRKKGCFYGLEYDGFSNDKQYCEKLLENNDFLADQRIDHESLNELHTLVNQDKFTDSKTKGTIFGATVLGGIGFIALSFTIVGGIIGGIIGLSMGRYIGKKMKKKIKSKQKITEFEYFNLKMGVLMEWMFLEKKKNLYNLNELRKCLYIVVKGFKLALSYEQYPTKKAAQTKKKLRKLKRIILTQQCQRAILLNCELFEMTVQQHKENFTEIEDKIGQVIFDFFIPVYKLLEFESKHPEKVHQLLSYIHIERILGNPLFKKIIENYSDVETNQFFIQNFISQFENKIDLQESLLEFLTNQKNSPINSARNIPHQDEEENDITEVQQKQNKDFQQELLNTINQLEKSKFDSFDLALGDDFDEQKNENQVVKNNGVLNEEKNLLSRNLTFKNKFINQFKKSNDEEYDECMSPLSKQELPSSEEQLDNILSNKQVILFSPKKKKANMEISKNLEMIFSHSIKPDEQGAYQQIQDEQSSNSSNKENGQNSFQKPEFVQIVQMEGDDFPELPNISFTPKAKEQEEKDFTEQQNKNLENTVKSIKQQEQIVQNNQNQRYIPECFKLINYYYEQALSKYKLVFKNKICSIYKQQQKGNPAILVKVFAEILDVQPNEIVNMIYDEKSRATWDSVCVGLKTLKTIDETTDYVHYTLNTPFGISKRDFFQERSILHNYPDSDQTTISFKSIVDNSVCPPVKKIIRADTIISAYIINKSKINPNSSTLCIISQVDIKGIIPKFIVNTVASKAPIDWINKMRKACLQASGQLPANKKKKK